MSAIEEAMGCACGEDRIDAILRLNGRLGLPNGIRQMDLSERLLVEIVQLTTEDHFHATNPREATADDYLRILRESL